LEESCHEAVGGLGDQNGVRLGQSLHPRCQVGGVTYGGVVHPEIVANPPHHDEPRIEP
jgi:hypothetical protein